MLFGIIYFPFVAIYQFLRSWWTTGNNNQKPLAENAKNQQAAAKEEKTGKTLKVSNF
jgi:hypothetical protein